MAALTQGDGKIGLFWPAMFHLFNDLGFGHILPVSLALVSKVSPRKMLATSVGIYYLAFFLANKIVGEVGGWYSTMPTPQFWLVHVGAAVVGLVFFVLFKLFASSLFGGHTTARGGERLSHDSRRPCAGRGPDELTECTTPGASGSLPAQG